MQNDKPSKEGKDSFEQTAGIEITQPNKHNPFEEKDDRLTKEEEEGIEEFKEAQTERD